MGGRLTATSSPQSSLVLPRVQKAQCGCRPFLPAPSGLPFFPFAVSLSLSLSLSRNLSSSPMPELEQYAPTAFWTTARDCFIHLIFQRFARRHEALGWLASLNPSSVACPHHRPAPTGPILNDSVSGPRLHPSGKVRLPVSSCRKLSAAASLCNSPPVLIPQAGRGLPASPPSAHTATSISFSILSTTHLVAPIRRLAFF